MTEIKQQFIQVKTKSNFESRLNAGDIKDTSIAFIEDSNQIWAKGKYYSAIPKEGYENQILTWKDNGEAEWKDLIGIFPNLEEVLAYGVQFDSTVADPHLTRIGNMSLHKSLPIQSQLKGCIAQGAKVMYWLNESDWRFRKEAVTQNVTLTISDDTYTLTADVFSTLQYDKQWVKIDSVACQISSIDTTNKVATLIANDELKALSLSSGTTTIELGSVLNGYDGTVRVYCPAFYIKSVTEGTISKVWLSTIKLDDNYTYQPEILIDAYRSTVLNTVPENMGYLSTLVKTSAVSVVNTNTYCRGGGNRSSYDTYLDTDSFRTDLNKPFTNRNLEYYREFSTNANSYILSYEQYKNIFYWLYVVEYANFNSQEVYNATLTSDGYRQGGLGDGLTTLDADTWYSYNQYGPITPNGCGNTLGNKTGLINITIEGTSYQVPRWRGFDNPFGDISTVVDGIRIIRKNAGTPGLVWICDDPDHYGDSPYKYYKYIGLDECVTSGYISSFSLGNAAHIIPSATSMNATSFMCDYHWATNKSDTGAPFFGGDAHSNAAAGLCAYRGDNTLYTSSISVGFRTVSNHVSFS